MLAKNQNGETCVVVKVGGIFAIDIINPATGEKHTLIGETDWRKAAPTKNKPSPSVAMALFYAMQDYIGFAPDWASARAASKRYLIPLDMVESFPIYEGDETNTDTDTDTDTD